MTMCWKEEAEEGCATVIYEVLIVPPRILTKVTIDGLQVVWRKGAKGKIFARSVLGKMYENEFTMKDGSTRTMILEIPEKRLIRKIGFRKVRGGGYSWLKICGYPWLESPRG